MLSPGGALVYPSLPLVRVRTSGLIAFTALRCDFPLSQSAILLTQYRTSNIIPWGHIFLFFSLQSFDFLFPINLLFFSSRFDFLPSLWFCHKNFPVLSPSVLLSLIPTKQGENLVTADSLTDSASRILLSFSMISICDFRLLYWPPVP